MTFRSRPLIRLGAAAAAVALGLSACSTDEKDPPPTSPTTTQVSSPTTTEPVATTPEPGQWTLDDLEVGAKVPKEDLERLFPKWEVPEPPATLTEFSEQGAIDAAVYYDRLADIAFYYNDPELINKIDTGICENCDALRSGVSQNLAKGSFLLQPSTTEAMATPDDVDPSIYEVRIVQEMPLSIEMDEAISSVKTMLTEVERESFNLLVFEDGVWNPAYLKLNESQL